jgi:MFS family permease
VSQLDLPSRASLDHVRHPSRLRKDLRRIVGSWIFGNLWLFTIGGAAMTKFARGLGMPDVGFGLLAAMPYLGTLFQLPASYLLRHVATRKRMFIITMTISRLSWVAMAMIPWLMPNSEHLWWQMMVMLTFVAWSTHHLGVPAWTGWIADLIPSQLRGRFFGICARYTQPIVLIAAIGVGYMLDLAEQVQPMRPGLMLRVTSSIVALAGLFGTLGIGFYRRVEDRPPQEDDNGDSWLSSITQPLRDRNFRRYVGMNVTFTLGVGFVGQYIWVYLFDIGLMQAWLANAIMVVLPRFVHMYSYGAWGRQIDKLGRKPVVIATLAMMTISPLGWILVGQPDPWLRWPGLCVAMLGIFAYPGFEIANLNIILGINSSRNEGAAEGGGGSSAYVVVNSMAVAIAGVLSGLIGLACARHYADLAWTMPVIGGTLTYHGLLLFLSFILRGLSLPWIIAVHDPGAEPTRDALRYMGANLYSNVRQALLTPTRVVGKVSRRTWRIGRTSR